MGLFSNPHQWAAEMVKTWPRFWFFVVFLSAVVAGLVYFAAFRGWHAAAGLAIFIGVYQLGMLYALRQILCGPPRTWS